MTGWQPIETAPKDGTAVLGYIPGGVDPSHGGVVNVWPIFWRAVWRNETGWHATLGEMDGHPEEGDWVVPTPVYPTHWMPLPDPPKEEAP